MSTLRFQGCQLFRYRIVSSTLSGRPVKITDIRSDDESPGLRDFEASFLRLAEKLSNGCKIAINETGTALRYTPGVIIGGDVTHDCGTSRSLGWYMEALIPLCVMGKEPSRLTLTGVTNDAIDLSVDTIRHVTLPLLKHFGIEVMFKVKRRGAQGGGGLVEVVIPVLRAIIPVSLTETGLVKRVRGVAFATRTNPTTASRMVTGARAVLNRLLPDVFIYTDTYKGAEGGVSAGFALSLVAESTTGMLLSVERCAAGMEMPEDVGKEGAVMLLEEISEGGCIDRSHTPLCILLMTMTSEDVTKVRVGSLTDAAIDVLRLVRDVWGVVFKIKPDPHTRTVLLSCLGTGMVNTNRKVS